MGHHRRQCSVSTYCLYRTVLYCSISSMSAAVDQPRHKDLIRLAGLARSGQVRILVTNPLTPPNPAAPALSCRTPPTQLFFQITKRVLTPPSAQQQHPLHHNRSVSFSFFLSVQVGSLRFPICPNKGIWSLVYICFSPTSPVLTEPVCGLSDILTW